MGFRKKRKDPFQEIQACLQRRDYKGAVDWFHTLLQKDPKNTQIRLRFADTLVLAGSKREAVKQYRVVADELADKGFMIRAIAINKKILQLDPNQTDVHQKLAEMNEERSSTSRLADALSSPGAPLRGAEPSEPEAPPAPTPPPEAVSPAEEALPELSLEESMAMEFGSAEEEPKAEAPPAPEEPIAAPPPSEPELEPPAPSGGFELVDESDAVSEPPAAAEAPLSDEPLSFAEEPVQFGDVGEGAPDEAEVEIEVVTQEADAPVEVALEGVEPPPHDAAEIVLEVDEVEAPAPADAPPETEIAPRAEVPEIVADEGGEGMEVIELDVETEPDMAADGSDALIAAIGEDIDSLIDSIIDDVGSSAKGEQPEEGEPPTHIPLFSDLTTAEFIDVAILLVRRVAKVGETIVREGDPGDSMFIISTGEVRATVEQNGQQVPVATLKDGDFFGEMAVLSGEPRSATVTAVKNTEVLELGRENLREICSRHPHVEAKIRLAYDERMSRTQTRQ